VEVKGGHQVDIVGTGGDGARTFNISTTCAFVVAAAGGRVAKHHARSASSHVGSADVLEKAGVRLGLPPEQVARCIEKLGIGFMFAPAHHSAMRHVAGTRKELGTRTLFNILGPLANPARVPNMLLGVFKRELVEQMAGVMKELGAGHVLVVHSEDGLDEISISDTTHVAELRDGRIESYTVTPEQFGLDWHKVTDIVVPGIDESLAMMRDVLDNRPGAARDVVLLNAGAAIYAAGLAGDIQAGIERAATVLADGSARERLEQLAAFSQALT
jgi:anthranilate phosphoribosyltransferase